MSKDGGRVWKQQSNIHVEIDDVAMLQQAISSFSLSDVAGTWKSTLYFDGKCYMNDLRSLIDSFVTESMYNVMIWVYLVLLKVNCFIWRGCIDKIPTASALSHRGLNIDDV